LKQKTQSPTFTSWKEKRYSQFGRVFSLKETDRRFRTFVLLIHTSPRCNQCIPEKEDESKTHQSQHQVLPLVVQLNNLSFIFCWTPDDQILASSCSTAENVTRSSRSHALTLAVMYADPIAITIHGRSGTITARSILPWIIAQASKLEE